LAVLAVAVALAWLLVPLLAVKAFCQLRAMTAARGLAQAPTRVVVVAVVVPVVLAVMVLLERGAMAVPVLLHL
jgi:hypothetical protein